MANVSYAIREDPSTIFLLEDAGDFYKDYCQICTFGKYLVRPEFLGKYMGFAPYFGSNGKFHGEPSKIKLSIEDKDQTPAYDYVAIIDSQVEFRVTPSVIRQLSKDHMPGWGMKSYLDYFSDQKSGIILFLRVFKIAKEIDPDFIRKGSRGSSQILKLYDQNEEEISLSVDIEYSVISKSKFDYIREEVIHLLKTENAYIVGYDSSADGLESLQKRIEVEHLVQGTRQRWELRNMQWVEAGYEVEDDFDMAQLDYEALYREVLKIEPAMESVIEYVRQVRPARLGEYDYLLKDVHEHNENERTASLRLFDMSMRLAIKSALYYYKRFDMDIQDSFQWACIGIIMAIQKHNDSVVGLFPSYTSMWIRQIVSREQETNNPQMYFSFNRKELYVNMYPILKQKGCIECSEVLTCLEVRNMIVAHTGCSAAKVKDVINMIIPFDSIDEYYDNELLFNDESFINIGHNSFSYDGDKQLFEEVSQILMKEQVEDVLDTLSVREEKVIRLRFGFNDGKQRTLEEIGKRYNLSRERIRQIEAKALRKLRHQSRSKKLRGYLYVTDEHVKETSDFKQYDNIDEHIPQDIKLTNTQRGYLKAVVDLLKQEKAIKLIDVANYVKKSIGTTGAAIRVLRSKGIILMDSEGSILLNNENKS